VRDACCDRVEVVRGDRQNLRSTVVSHSQVEKGNSSKLDATV
jgi:hypothetical protein